MNSNIIDKIFNLLRCPLSNERLVLNKEKNFLKPLKNSREYLIKGNQIIFNNENLIINKFVNTKNIIKERYTFLYYFILKFFGPTFPYNIKKEINKYININDNKKILLDLGSGNLKLHKNFINLDSFPYKQVNIVCDAKNIPFLNNSADLIFSKSFLEHADEPNKIVDEIYRVLKPGGFSIHSVPFLYPYHASPFDYQRYTEEGLKKLFKKFETKKIIPIAGPFSLINVIFLELFSSLFKIFSKNLSNFTFILLMILTSPIKYLDYFFLNFKIFENLTVNYLIISQKKN